MMTQTMLFSVVCDLYAIFLFSVYVYESPAMIGLESFLSPMNEVCDFFFPKFLILCCRKNVVPDL